MTTRTLVFIALLTATAAQAVAQPTRQPAQAPRARSATPTPEAAPPSPPPAPAVAGGAIRRARPGQPINVKVEFTLTDQRAEGPAVKRTVSVIVADAYTGQIRSQSDVFGIGAIPLNIDTSPELLTDGKIRVGFNLQYDWPAPLDQTTPGPNPPRGTVMKTAMQDSMSLILESGKSMVAAQSADPIGDRKVTVEVKATILK